MAKIKFHNTDFLNTGEVKLKTVISLMNEHQSGEGFAAFINQIIVSFPSEIIHLEIMLSTELYAHYYGAEEARNLTNTWIEKNQEYLDKLTDYNIPYSMDTLAPLMKLSKYDCYLKEVQKLYETDNQFFHMVDELTDMFAQKIETSIESTTHFLLEECAISLCLTGYIAYPHKEINSAISYVTSKFENNFIYIGYSIDYKKNQSMIQLPETLSPHHPLYQQLLTLQNCFEQYGIKGRDQQTRYYNTFIKAFEERKKWNTSSCKNSKIAENEEINKSQYKEKPSILL